jgi:hypothetical protein
MNQNDSDMEEGEVGHDMGTPQPAQTNQLLSTRPDQTNTQPRENQVRMFISSCWHGCALDDALIIDTVSSLVRE